MVRISAGQGHAASRPPTPGGEVLDVAYGSTEPDSLRLTLYFDRDLLQRELIPAEAVVRTFVQHCFVVHSAPQPMLQILKRSVDEMRTEHFSANRRERPLEWAAHQYSLGTALQMLGVGEPFPNPKLLEDAVKAFQKSLRVYTRVDKPRERAVTQINLAAALLAQGQRPKVELALSALQDALSVVTRTEYPKEWGAAQNNLKAAWLMLGDPTVATDPPADSTIPAVADDPTGEDGDAEFAAFLDEAARTPDDDDDNAESFSELPLLGGARSIGTTIVGPSDLIRAVENGFRVEVIDRLLNAGFTKGEIERLVLPSRTLNRRRREGRLSPVESDVVLRLARILSKAKVSFGGNEQAFGWLRHPNRALGGAIPMNMVATEVGGRYVQDLLLRADYGMLA